MMNVQIDHAVIPVRTGAMTEAIEFMTKVFGFTIEDYEVNGDWGRARFVYDGVGTRIQLTEPAKQKAWIRNAPERETSGRALPLPTPMLEWVHVGFKCDVQQTRTEIKMFCQRQLLVVNFEDVPGGKLFVSIPEMLWIDIELVPV